MLLKDIDPFVRHVRHFTVSETTPSAGKDVRTRDNRIFFVTDGEGDIIIDGKRERLTTDTLVFIRAGRTYKLTPTQKMSVVVVNFDFTNNFSTIKQSFHPFSSDFPGVLEEVTFEDTDLLSTEIVLHSAPFLAESVRNLVNEFYGTSQWREPLLSASVKALVIETVTKACERGESARSPLVQSVIRYMQEHYSERVENETFAEHLHFTPTYINRVFKAQMGVSLRQYLIALRVNIAKELLATGEYTPSEAAQAVGFEDYPHFSKTFKRLTGNTPQEYQKAGAHR